MGLQACPLHQAVPSLAESPLGGLLTALCCAEVSSTERAQSRVPADALGQKRLHHTHLLGTAVLIAKAGKELPWQSCRALRAKLMFTLAADPRQAWS